MADQNALATVVNRNAFYRDGYRVLLKVAFIEALVILVLLASLIWFPVHHGHATWHELLITIFLFLTAPVTGFFIAKAHMHLGWDADELPRPSPGKNWATFAAPDQESLVDKVEAARKG